MKPTLKTLIRRCDRIQNAWRNGVYGTAKRLLCIKQRKDDKHLKQKRMYVFGRSKTL
jgi:hypothetical protein